MCVKLSVVIPVYNIEDYIGKCLDSVLAQTYQNYEVIIVDDGSTDGTAGVCDEYAQKDERIRVIHKKNEGVSVARNTGIDIATGEYFLFFDGDDFMEPYTMEELCKIALEKQADTVIYGYHRYENGKVKETCYPRFEKTIYEKEDIVEQVLPAFIGLSYDKINDWLNHKADALYVENPALWRTMTSAKLIKENNIRFLPGLKVGEDTLFISTYLSYAKRCYIQQKCYYYLVTRETSTIFVYEKKPLQKLEGKIHQLQARLELTEDVIKRENKDINETWRGTIVMSAIEMAFLLSNKIPGYSYKERYQMYLSYAKLPEVERSVEHFEPACKFQIKKIPFLLLKRKLYAMLFLATTVLHFVHYEFSRS
ncbi:MAG: glycosyltransferase [Lachnospiraceae bacterium]|nr:glycosyltransferase [Lachnospiraceae bacterium]